VRQKIVQCFCIVIPWAIHLEVRDYKNNDGFPICGFIIQLGDCIGQGSSFLASLIRALFIIIFLRLFCSQSIKFIMSAIACLT